MSKRILVLMVAASMAGSLGAVSQASETSGPFSTRVRILDFRFAPRRVEIGQGTAVLWKNVGDQTHTSTGRNGLWDSGDIAPGDKFRRRFNDTGVFRYFCEIHPDMRGRVIVGDV